MEGVLGACLPAVVAAAALLLQDIQVGGEELSGVACIVEGRVECTREGGREGPSSSCSSSSSSCGVPRRCRCCCCCCSKKCWSLSPSHGGHHALRDGAPARHGGGPGPWLGHGLLLLLLPCARCLRAETRVSGRARKRDRAGSVGERAALTATVRWGWG